MFRIWVFWAVTLCHWVSGNHCPSEKSATQCHIPKDLNLILQSYGNQL